MPRPVTQSLQPYDVCPGWTRAGWVAYLRQRAANCMHPARAAELADWAAELERQEAAASPAGWPGFETIRADRLRQRDDWRQRLHD